MKKYKEKFGLLYKVQKQGKPIKIVCMWDWHYI